MKTKHKEKKVTKNKKFLSEAKIDEKVKIVSFHDDLETKSILIGMGILTGDELEILNKSLFGSSIYFKHGESNFFALRKNEASLIEVE
ncbi:MAG: FeoA family protein [Candidatus Sericytochromatia bacterium]